MLTLMAETGRSATHSDSPRRVVVTALVEWFDRLLDRLALAASIVVMDIIRWATAVCPGTEADA